MRIDGKHFAGVFAFKVKASFIEFYDEALFDFCKAFHFAADNLLP